MNHSLSFGRILFVKEKEQLSPLEHATRRLADPSWLMLGVLMDGQAVPGFTIIHRVEQLYIESNYPIKTIDPSTVHYAIKRMMEIGVISSPGIEIVNVRGPHGSTRQEPRSLYQITDLGREAMMRRFEITK